MIYPKLVPGTVKVGDRVTRLTRNPGTVTKVHNETCVNVQWDDVEGDDVGVMITDIRGEGI